MNLGKRLDKLEWAGGDDLVILIVDEFPQDGEPIIRDALVGGRLVKRDAAEDQDTFVRRVSQGRLQADSGDL